MATPKHAVPRKESKNRLTTEMSPALEKACDEIRQLFAQHTLKDVQGRYAIGKRIKQVRDGDGKSTYGMGAMKKLALELHRSEESLRKYAMVSELWTETAVRSIVEKPDRNRNRLTWSHLVELAGVTSSKERESLIEKTREKGYSVRELKNCIAGRGEDKQSDEATDRPAKFDAGIRKMMAQSEILVNNATLWKTVVFDRVKAANPAEFDENFRNTLVRAREVQSKAEAACRGNREEVDACLVLVDKALAERSRKSKKKSA